MTEERLLTVREVARLCERSEETVRRWIWSGKLPARKLGNQLFIAEGEVGRLQQAQRISEAQAKYRAGDEVVARHGPVDVVALITEPAPRLSERQFRLLETREKKLRKALLQRHGYIDAAELVRRSREGH